MRLPSTLDGVRVLDLTRLLPGPFATWQLRVMGAEVLKVEDTGMGDYARAMPPMIGAVSALFHVLNRGKRSIAVDLKREAGRDLLLELVRTSDVMVEQFRPGVLDRLGLGWDALRAARPDLILCHITGYGQNGPLRDAAGHDSGYQALAGSLWMQGERGGRPTLPAIPTADLAGAMEAVASISAALYHREKTGEGARLDVAMADAIGGWFAPFAAAWTAAPPGRGPARGEALLSGGIAQYDTYACKDGGHLAVGALEPKFFALFAAVAGRPEWATVPPFPGPHQDALRAEVAAVVAERSRDEWAALLRDVDCCVEPVLDPGEAAAHPHYAERGLAGSAKLPDGRIARWVESPLGPTPDAPAPAQGEHTRAVLRELGLDDAAISRLAAEGTIRC